MSQKINKLENGTVMVRVRSRRGTGTRDQDEITIEAVFDDMDEAESQSGRINHLVQERMADARKVGNAEASEETNQENPEISKVYLGDGSKLSGWIPLPKQVVFDEIAPLVSKNPVEGDDLPGIKVNFSKEVPISGWHEVDAEVVSTEIEPRIRNHRLDESD